MAGNLAPLKLRPYGAIQICLLLLLLLFEHKLYSKCKTGVYFKFNRLVDICTSAFCSSSCVTGACCSSRNVTAYRSTGISCNRRPHKLTTHRTQSCTLYVQLRSHTHPFNGPFSGTTRVSQYQKGETNLDFAEARDSEWQWHQLGHMHLAPDR